MKGRTIFAVLLAYLVPGAGHLYLGKRARAITFFCVVILMFLIGLAIDGELYRLQNSGGSILRTLAALGSMGAGLPYFIATGMGIHGDVTAIAEYGSAFTISAGLMNLLLMLDAFDIAQGRKK